MTITALPTPPSRLNPVNFSERADAFLGALPQFVNEANSLEALTQYNALVGSCTNTLSIATGTKTISTQTNKAWVAGMYVYLIYPTDPTQTMTGTVSSYNTSSGALIVNVTQVTGSGSYSNWNIVTVNPPQSAANVSGGSAGQILYQTAANTTGFMHPANAIAIATATGTPNAITATYTPAISALTDGMTLYAWTTTTNTTVNPTFTPAPGTIAPKTIVKGSGAALEVDDIVGWAEFQYSAALDKWVLQNPARGVKTGITMSATIAITSGSTIDVTGIPAGALRVTIHMDQIGTNGVSAKLIQIGSGSFLTSGYKSVGVYAGAGNTAGGSSATNGFYIQSVSAVDRLCGEIKLSRLPGFVYEQSHVLSTNINGVCTGGGTVVSNGSIDRIRLTTKNGTDSFVAGWLTISWEF